MNVMVDIDGTVSDDISNKDSHLFRNASVIDGSVEAVNGLYNRGHNVTFFTARLESHREDTEFWLKENGFKYHSLLMEKPQGGNYVWIDNLKVTGIHFKGDWKESLSEFDSLT